MSKNVPGRMTKLEQTAPAAARERARRVRVPSELGGWWRAYLDKSLATAELVDLAEAVTAVQEGRPLSAGAEMAAEVAWGQVWARAGDVDLRRLVKAFGPRAGWRQVLTAEPE